jgi:hypothetical protein
MSVHRVVSEAVTEGASHPVVVVPRPSVTSPRDPYERRSQP